MSKLQDPMSSIRGVVLYTNYFPLITNILLSFHLIQNCAPTTKIRRLNANFLNRAQECQVTATGICKINPRTRVRIPVWHFFLLSSVGKIKLVPITI